MRYGLMDGSSRSLSVAAELTCMGEEGGAADYC